MPECELERCGEGERLAEMVAFLDAFKVRDFRELKAFALWTWLELEAVKGDQEAP